MISKIDRLLREIEELDGRLLKNKRSEYIQEIIRFQNLSSSNFSSQVLFSPTNTLKQKQFIAACLLRLLCHNEKAIWEDTDFRIKTFSFFDEQLSDIYPSLRIGERTKNHEKLSYLKDLEQNILSEFKSIASGFTSLKAATDLRKRIMKALRKPANKILIQSFIDTSLISEERLKELFDSLKSYEEASGVARMETFHTVDATFSKYVRDVKQCASEFSAFCLENVFSKIHNLIRDDFGKSDIIKPATVKLLHTNRKYPFHKKNQKIELKLVLKNEGLGHAFDVRIEVLDADGLMSDFNQVIETEMKVESFNIVLYVTTLSNETASYSLLVSWSWKNYDKSSISKEEIFEFEPQREDIDWDNLKFRSPYSLQAVATEKELIGRKELVANIYANLISDTIESAMIFGQKRVGKTSIAKALGNKLQNEESFVPVFIKVGDLNTTSPQSLIKTLGDEIVEETIGHDKLSKFEIIRPTFDEVLSPPLARYFKQVKKNAPNLKFIIIIDEFDEIHSDLYRYTDIGSTFFHNIRSLSQEGTQIGFILVGGENMQIIRQSTDRLNLFSPFQVDYFDKEKFFGDFKELIRYPVQDILEFSDESIDEIYKLTEGNPFFTKFVCDKLFKQACEKKDSYVSIDEAKEAITESIESLDTINVNHFWIDGIWEDQSEKRDQIQTQRRKFLIAYAEIKRRNNGKVKRQEILESKILSNIAVDSMIENFINRGILLEEDGYFRLKPRLFDDWLTQRGSQLLTSSFSDKDALEELRSKEDKAYVTDKEIVKLTKSWGLYRSKEITPSHVRSWLNQFTDNIERRLMLRLLENVTFYSEVKIREKLKVIHGNVRKNMTFSIKDDERRIREILLSSFDKPTKSSSSYSRMYASENNIISTNVASLEDIPQALEKDKDMRISALVFIDDIIASGGSIIAGINKLNQLCGEMIAARNIKVVIAAICGLESGKENIENKNSEVPFEFEIYTCDTLNNSNRCFTDESSFFEDDSEKRKAKEIVRKYGTKLQKKQPLGFDEGQLLVVFYDTCPNNSLPILWYSSEALWSPLFRRH